MTQIIYTIITITIAAATIDCSEYSIIASTAATRMATKSATTMKRAPTQAIPIPRVKKNRSPGYDSDSENGLTLNQNSNTHTEHTLSADDEEYFSVFSASFEP